MAEPIHPVSLMLSGMWTVVLTPGSSSRIENISGDGEHYKVSALHVEKVRRYLVVVEQSGLRVRYGTNKAKKAWKDKYG